MVSTRRYRAPQVEPVADLVVQSRPVPKAVALITLFSIVLIRLPILISGHTSPLKFTTIALFIGGGMWAFPAASRRVNPTVARLLAIYLLIVTIAIVRGATYGGYTWHTGLIDATVYCSLAFFAVGLCASGRTGEEMRSRWALVAYTPAVYVGVNALLRQTGGIGPLHMPPPLPGALGTSNELLKLIGIHSGRTAFPLAGGLNNFGSIAAAGFASAAVLAIANRRGERKLPIVAAGLCLYGVLATDTRAAFLLSLAVVLFFALRRRVSAAKGMAVFLPLSPVLVLTSLSFLAGSGVLGGLSRQSGDLSTGNNRLFIWRAVLHVIDKPDSQLIFGFGGYGQVKSGAAYVYSYLFTDGPASYSHTAHNIVLQTVLDEGYVGLVVLVAVVVTALLALERSAPRESRSSVNGVTAALIVLVLAGATEALPSYLFPDTLALFVLLLGAAAGSSLPVTAPPATPAAPALNGAPGRGYSSA